MKAGFGWNYGGNLETIVESFTPNSNQDVFLLNNAPDLKFKPILAVNGQEQKYAFDYYIDRNNLYWISNDFVLGPTDNIDVYYS